MNVSLLHVRVLAVFLREDQPQYALGLVGPACVRMGTIYALLHQLEEAGWLSSIREDDTVRRSRPPRREYALTDAGRAGSLSLLRELRTLLLFLPADPAGASSDPVLS